MDVELERLKARFPLERGSAAETAEAEPSRFLTATAANNFVRPRRGRTPGLPYPESATAAYVSLHVLRVIKVLSARVRRMPLCDWNRCETCCSVRKRPVNSAADPGTFLGRAGNPDIGRHPTHKHTHTHRHEYGSAATGSFTGVAREGSLG